MASVREEMRQNAQYMEDKTMNDDLDKAINAIPNQTTEHKEMISKSKVEQIQDCFHIPSLFFFKVSLSLDINVLYNSKISILDLIIAGPIFLMCKIKKKK